MGDDIALQPSKKRAAGREISRDNPGLDDDDNSVQETGTFQRASDEVLASRRIVKARRQQISSATSEAMSNPFAGIRLVPPPTASIAVPAEATTETQADGAEEAGEEVDKKHESNTETINASVLDVSSSENKADEIPSEFALDKKKIDTAVKRQDAHLTDDNEDGSAEKAAESERECEKETVDHAEKKIEEKPADKNEDEGENVDNFKQKNDDNANKGAAAPFSSFQQLSSTPNAFSGLSGTGFSSSTFSFGSIHTDRSSSGSFPSFSFGTSNNGSDLSLGTIVGHAGNKTEGSGFPSMKDVQVETGEENEEAVFSADSVLFEFLDGSWRERGKGEVKVNVTKSGTQKARLVMRTRGNLRLILNAYIYSDMKLANMDKRGITFACVNSATEGKDGLGTFALKFKDASFAESFSAAITAHKDKAAIITHLKTPENSPKASDD